ncbi:MAG TPA: trypsin-like peptidase domain-containing protein [Nitrososphaerales archaeon]|nr:trypsin-like peptidase domain-containing protein [Nitrososphaerales archaeon]
MSISTGRRGGTGIVWSDDGLLVTANHVIGGATAPQVKLSDGTELEAKLVGRDPYTDVAVLRVDSKGLKAIAHEKQGTPRVGEFVLALANPYGVKASATSGIVTSPSRSMRGWWGMTIENAVVSDAKLNPGYSGGPLVSASGSLVGMNVAYFSGRGVAVSAETLRETVEKLLKDGRVKKGYLGVVVETVELPEELAGSEGVGQDTGLMVRSVETGSPARAAGVVIGDVIVSLGDSKALDEYGLHKALSEETVGKPVALQVLRGEKLTKLTVTPKEAEA